MIELKMVMIMPSGVRVVEMETPVNARRCEMVIRRKCQSETPNMLGMLKDDAKCWNVEPLKVQKSF